MKLPEITAGLSEKKIDLRTLMNHVRTHCPAVDPFEWEEFEQAVCQEYALTREEFREKFTLPTFLHEGFYPDEFRDVMEKENITGFARRYADQYKETESPSSYHFACALAILGASLGRQVWFDQQIFKIYPALQVLILGPSGQVAKSTAGNAAIKLLEASERAYRIASIITPESLYQGLGQRTKLTGAATGILYSSEMSTLFTKAESYNQGLIQQLTDLFDCPDKLDKQTKTAGDDKILNVAVSFIGCSNEGWADFLNESAMMGGMFGRCVVMYQEGAVCAVPFPQLNDPAEYDNLKHMLQLTKYIEGDFTITTEGREWYATKYHWIKTHYPNDERIHPFWSRYGVHLIRLGMLFRIGEMIAEGHDLKKPVLSMPRIIEVKHLKWADSMLAWIGEKMPRILFALGSTRQGGEVSKIVRFIARKGGAVSEGAIMREMLKRMAPRVLREHLESLVTSGTLKRTTATVPIDGTVGYELRRTLEEI